MILCASGLRFAAAGGEPQQVARLASDAGFDGVAIGAECTRKYVTPLATAVLAAGLVSPVMAAPVEEAPFSGGRRAPYLAALDDDDERRAAVAQFTSTLELAVPLGMRVFTVYLGAVPLGTNAQEIARRFARAELLDEDGPGAPLWAAAVGERRAISGMVLDACRYALDRIVPQAERRDAHIAIEVAGDPWSAPTPREAETLLAEYSGGPLGLVWDEARMQVLGTLGISPSAERRARLVAAAKVWRANDAVGIETGYLPGQGDPPYDDRGHQGRNDESRDDVGAAKLQRSSPPAGVPVIVTGSQESTTEEIIAARLGTAAAAAAS